MFRNNVLLCCAVCAIVVCVVFTSDKAIATPIPNVHDILSRGFVSTDAFGDDALGNGWTREDMFTNIDSDTYRVQLDLVEWFFINPNDLGFGDITSANGLDVLTAAEASYPDYIFGVSFWTDQDPPIVNWTNSGTVVNLGGILLNPGEACQLQTTAHNDIMGFPAGIPADNWALIGEVVVGWKFSGVVTEIPEPTVLLLSVIGGVTLLAGRKKTSR